MKQEENYFSENNNIYKCLESPLENKNFIYKKLYNLAR